MNRNSIYAALLAQLSQLKQAPYNVLTVTRGFTTWDEVDMQPAILIVPKTEAAEYKRGFPTKWMIELDLYIYVRWTDTVDQGTEALTSVMDGVEAVLSPLGVNGNANPTNAVNTLGGLVQYCALQGQADISLGFLNKAQTVARMPVEILTA